MVTPFSKLKQIENRLRTPMTQGRKTSHFSYHMSIELDILREIDFTAIISDFTVAKSRQMSGLWL